MSSAPPFYINLSPFDFLKSPGLTKDNGKLPKTTQIKGPDGSVYEVTSPEGASDDDILAYAQRNPSNATLPPGFELEQNDPAALPPGFIIEQPSASPNFEIDKVHVAADAPPVADGPMAPEVQPDDAISRYVSDQERLYQESIKKVDLPPSQVPTNEEFYGENRGPGFATRQLGSLNEGIADTLGAPVDLANAAMGAIGLPTSDKPFLGSESIRGGMHALGIGQTSDEYAPRSALERYTQAASRGVGQSVIPAGGLPAMGARALLKAAPILEQAAPSLVDKALGAVKAGGRTLVTEAAKRPGVAVAAELGSSAGSGTGAQVARDVAPGNEAAEVAGALIGGLGGGIGVGRQVQKGLTPKARFEALHADNRHLGVDAAIGSDIERVVSSVPRHDASGRKIPASVRAATWNSRVDRLERAYLPTRGSIDALDILPSQRAAMKGAIDKARILSPEEIEGLRSLPHGDDLADSIIKVQRLRHYIPEGGAGAGPSGLASLAADTGAVALGSYVGGPLGAAGVRAGGKLLASKLAGKDATAEAIKSFAGQASRLRNLARAKGVMIPVGGSKLEASSIQAKDEVYLARQASKAKKAREALETQNFTEDNRRIGISNDRANVKPGGGMRGLAYERTGLLPAQQDEGALRLLNEGVISQDQFDAFLRSPEKMMRGNGGNALIDRLAAMADDGTLARDPKWSPPQPQARGLDAYQDAMGQPIRNVEAYRAGAKGKQDRLTTALHTVWNNADLEGDVKETIGSVISKLGSTSQRVVADKMVESAIRKLPEEHRAYGRSILSPLLEQIKH